MVDFQNRTVWHAGGAQGGPKITVVALPARHFSRFNWSGTKSI
jgi:hypothetical protein